MIYAFASSPHAPHIFRKLKTGTGVRETPPEGPNKAVQPVVRRGTRSLIGHGSVSLSPTPREVKSPSIGVKSSVESNEAKAITSAVQIKIEVEDQPGILNRMSFMTGTPSPAFVPLKRSASERQSAKAAQGSNQAGKDSTLMKRSYSSTSVICRERSLKRLRPNLIGHVT
ncbi:hypothetical protein IQ07DRAFT_671093 [Pyrenochaeta sp. DS3sAY3a]|nr:hypothetical protein IQ07DRAFT_671093 [Pyrenochaeta sp. DS3sAY3a]